MSMQKVGTIKKHVPDLIDYLLEKQRLSKKFQHIIDGTYYTSTKESQAHTDTHTDKVPHTNSHTDHDDYSDTDFG